VGCAVGPLEDAARSRLSVSAQGEDESQGRGEAIVVGGTNGIGRAIAEALAARGDPVVVAGRSIERAESVAREIGESSRALAVDLTRQEEISGALSDIESVCALVLTAAEPNENSVSEFDAGTAARLASLKLTGYTSVVAALAPRFAADSAVLMFGGNAKDRPYPGSTTLTTVNAGLAGLTRALAIELAPVRVNAIHPGIVADSPAWRDAPAEFLDEVRQSTPTGKLVTLADVVGASLFALDNASLSGVSLNIDGGSSIL
jgi:NAD(P)-dependent dehydrogenase (short-subunit alcohol dehydrogenase family)